MANICWTLKNSQTVLACPQDPNLVSESDPGSGPGLARFFVNFSMFCKTRWCILFLPKTRAKQAKKYTPPDFYEKLWNHGDVYVFCQKANQNQRKCIHPVLRKNRKLHIFAGFLPCACLRPHGPGSMCMTSCSCSKKFEFSTIRAIWHPS